jgi:chromosome segregation ATPase
MDLSDSEFGAAPEARAYDSDADSQVRADQELAEHRVQLETLRRENSLLRAQIDQAVALTKGMEDIHQQNLKLGATIRSLEQTNTDLTRRMEISLHAHEEINAQLCEERRTNAQNQAHAATERDRELALIQTQHKEQLSEAETKFRKCQEDHEQMELQQRMLLSKVDRLLQNAGQYFDTTIGGIDEVSELLSRPYPLQIPTEQIRSPSDENGEVHRLKAKVKKQRGLLRNGNQEREKQANEIARLERDLADQERKLQQQTRVQEKKCTEAIEGYEAKAKEDAALIHEMTGKNEQLRAEVADLKKQIRESIPVPPIVIPETKKPDNEWKWKREIEQLKEALQEAIEKAKGLETQRDEVLQKLSVSNKKRTQLESDLEKQRNENTGVEIIHSQAVAEIKALRESFLGKPDLKSESEAKKRAKKVQARIDELEGTVKSQAKTIHEIAIDREADKHRLENQNLKIAALTVELSEIEQRLASANADLAEARAVISSHPQISSDDIMPTSSWKFPDFDPALSQQIEKIASNSILQPPSKLLQIYRAIVKFYGDQMKNSESIVQSITAKYERLRALLNQFSIDASLLLLLNPINFDEFVENGGAATLFNRITNIVQRFDETSRRVQEYDSLTEYISSLFGDTPDPFARMSEIKELIDAQAAHLKAKTKKNRDLRAQIHQTANATDQRISELTSENAQLTEALQESERNADEANTTVKRMKKELQATKQQLKQLEVAAADTETGLKTDHERYIQSIHYDNTQIQMKYNEQIEKLKAELLAASNANVANEATISKLQKFIGIHAKTIAEKSERIASLEREKNGQLEECASQYKAENENLVQSYETALAELRAQCDSHRQNLETVSRELAASEERYRKGARLLSILKHEKTKLTSELASLRETNDRSLQVATAVGRTAELAAQESMTQKLQDVRTNLENERRRLFSVAADEFRTYFNAAETLDERSYRQLLAKVKTELKRLAESDASVRRLIGAAPGQPTDDAVAHLVDC